LSGQGVKVHDYLLPLSLLAASGGVIGSGSEEARETERTYMCAFGISFSVRINGKRATVVTRSHRYELVERPFSLGPRYGSDTTAFAQDEDRVVLIGAEDGPYRNCIEVRQKH
jgi:hypothetical protein